MLKIGHEYMVNHSRKGRFFMRVTEDNDILVTGIITLVSRTVSWTAIPEKEGEEIIVRKVFCGFKLVEESTE